MKRFRIFAMLLWLLSLQNMAPLLANAPGPAPDIDCAIFPANNIWNTPVNTLPVDTVMTNVFLNDVGAGTTMHQDFASGEWPPGSNSPIGIPITIVNGSQPPVRINYTAYGNESDPGPFPIPTTAAVEGVTGDRHVIVVDETNCIAYELYNAYPQPDGSWNADSGARYDLNSNALRPAGWTSADAAGLPILPGLVRYEEVLQGSINHAIRFNLTNTSDSYVWPARHESSTLPVGQYLPMGARLRLRADFDISGFDPVVQIILQAMKTYGMILADQGNNMVISGVPDSRWNDSALRQFRTITAGNFEVVDTCSLKVDPNSAQAQFGANPGCSAQIPTVTPPATATVRPTNTVVPPTSTPFPTNTPTLRPTNTATPRPTNTATPTLRPTNTATPRPTNTLVPPTATPATGVLGARIFTPLLSVARGSTVMADIMLDNPASASGGGVKAAAIECFLAPTGMLVGQSVTRTSLFGANSTVNNRGFTSSSRMYYRVTTTIPISTGGMVARLNMNAALNGAATITCTFQVTTANNSNINLVVAPLTITIIRTVPSSTPRPTNTAPPRPTNTPTARPTDIGGGQEVTPTLRPTNTPTPRPTNTATPRPTNTPVPPTATPRPTNTPVPPTATPRPTNTPIAATVASRIVIPGTIYAGTNFNVGITLDNPAAAAGGGVDAMEIQCSVTPTTRLIGQSFANGTVFGPNAVIVSQPTTSSIVYAVSQSGTNPPVTVGGTVLTLTIRAASVGQGTMTCAVEIIDGNGMTTVLSVAPVTITVR